MEEGPLGETQSLRASLRLVTRGEARGLHPALPAQKKSGFLGNDSNYCWAETAPRWVDFQLPDAAGALTLTHTSTRPFLLPPLHAPPPPSGENAPLSKPLIGLAPNSLRASPHPSHTDQVAVVDFSNSSANILVERLPGGGGGR